MFCACARIIRARKRLQRYAKKHKITQFGVIFFLKNCIFVREILPQEVFGGSETRKILRL